MTLVDTNVLLDVATNDRDWAEWSVNRLDAAAIRGPLLINAVVYAEFSVGFVRVEEVDRVFDDAGFEIVTYRARRCFSQASCSSAIAAREVPAPEFCPISSSAPTRPSRKSRY